MFNEFLAVIYFVMGLITFVACWAILLLVFIRGYIKNAKD